MDHRLTCLAHSVWSSSTVRPEVGPAPGVPTSLAALPDMVNTGTIRMRSLWLPWWASRHLHLGKVEHRAGAPDVGDDVVHLVAGVDVVTLYQEPHREGEDGHGVEVEWYERA